MQENKNKNKSSVVAENDLFVSLAQYGEVSASVGDPFIKGWVSNENGDGTFQFPNSPDNRRFVEDFVKSFEGRYKYLYPSLAFGAVEGFVGEWEDEEWEEEE